MKTLISKRKIPRIRNQLTTQHDLMTKDLISWTIRLVAAITLLQTLFFKFTAAPESVEIFTMLGLEPHGRILIGVLELIAAGLLIIPRTVVYGGLLGMGLMGGAIMSHVTRLGWSGEMRSLGMLAVLVFVLCLATLVLHRKDYPSFTKNPKSK